MSNDFNVEEQAQWLDSLEVKPFDSKGIMLASKIAREVRKRSGVVVALSGKQAVADLGRAVLEVDDPDLNHLFTALLDSVAKEPAEGAAASFKKKLRRKSAGSDSDSDRFI
ncbi:MAG: hypothetical protein MK188_08000 [Gammaproteobacteria bacterium]|nr:hypothetical protein [Gammaproteobacteria bacterium]